MLAKKNLLKQKELLKKTIDKNLHLLLKDACNKIDNTTSSVIVKLFKINCTRSKLLINLLEHEASVDFIVNYSIVIELLNLASQMHGIIESSYNIIGFKQLSIEKIILIGDLLFTIAFEQMLKLNNNAALEHFAETTQEMSIHEAILTEYSGVNTHELLELIEKKYWPLFNSILFFFKINSKYNTSSIEEYLKNFNAGYVRDKIKNRTLTVSKKFEPILERFNLCSV